MAGTANLARSKRADEPPKEEKNWSNQDIPPTNGVEFNLGSGKSLVVGPTADWICSMSGRRRRFSIRGRPLSPAVGGDLQGPPGPPGRSPPGRLGVWNHFDHASVTR